MSEAQENLARILRRAAERLRAAQRPGRTAAALDPTGRRGRLAARSRVDEKAKSAKHSGGTERLGER